MRKARTGEILFGPFFVVEEIMATEIVKGTKSTRSIAKPKRSVRIKKGGDMSRMVKAAY